MVAVATISLLGLSASIIEQQWLVHDSALKIQSSLARLLHGGHEGRVYQSSQLASGHGSCSQVCLDQQHTVYFDLQLSGSPLCLRGSEASQEVELCHLLTPKLQRQILPALKSKTYANLLQIVSPLTHYFCGCSTLSTTIETEQKSALGLQPQGREVNPTSLCFILHSGQLTSI